MDRFRIPNRQQRKSNLGKRKLLALNSDAPRPDSVVQLPKGLGHPPLARRSEVHSKGKVNSSAAVMAKKKLFLFSPQDTPFQKQEVTCTYRPRPEPETPSDNQQAFNNCTFDETGVNVFETLSPNSSIQQSVASNSMAMQPGQSFPSRGKVMLPKSRMPSQFKFYDLEGVKTSKMEDSNQPIHKWQLKSLNKSPIKPIEISFNNNGLFSSNTNFGMRNYIIERPKTPIFYSDLKSQMNPCINIELSHSPLSLKKSTVNLLNTPKQSKSTIQQDVKSILSEKDNKCHHDPKGKLIKTHKNKVDTIQKCKTDENQFKHLPPALDTSMGLNTTDEFVLAEMTIIEQNKTNTGTPELIAKSPLLFSKSSFKQNKSLMSNFKEEINSDDELQLLTDTLNKLNCMKVELENTTKVVQTLLEKHKSKDSNKENCPLNG